MLNGFQSVRGLGVVVVALLALQIVLVLATIPSSLMQLAVLDAIEVGTATDDEIAWNDTREQALGLIAFVLYLVTGITYLVWFDRAYKNLRAFDHEPRHATGWAVGGWIVPIVSLFRPFQITREIWNVSDPAPGARDTSIEESPPLLVGWWALWLLGNVVGQVSFRMSMNADTIEGLRGVTGTQIVADAITLASAPLAILVVRAITARQESLAARLASSQLTDTEREGLQRTFE